MLSGSLFPYSLLGFKYAGGGQIFGIQTKIDLPLGGMNDSSI